MEFQRWRANDCRTPRHIYTFPSSSWSLQCTALRAVYHFLTHMRGSSLEQTVLKVICVPFLESLVINMPCHSSNIPRTTSSFCSAPPSLFPTTLHAPGIRHTTKCATPRLGGSSGHVADTTQTTVYEPKTCIEVSSEFTPINFQKRKLQP